MQKRRRLAITTRPRYTGRGSLAGISGTQGQPQGKWDTMESEWEGSLYPLPDGHSLQTCPGNCPGLSIWAHPLPRTLHSSHLSQSKSLSLPHGPQAPHTALSPPCPHLLPLFPSFCPSYTASSLSLPHPREAPTSVPSTWKARYSQTSRLPPSPRVSAPTQPLRPFLKWPAPPNTGCLCLCCQHGPC